MSISSLEFHYHFLQFYFLKYGLTNPSLIRNLMLILLMRNFVSEVEPLSGTSSSTFISLSFRMPQAILKGMLPCSANETVCWLLKDSDPFSSVNYLTQQANFLNEYYYLYCLCLILIRYQQKVLNGYYQLIPLTLRQIFALFQSRLPSLIPVVQSLSDEFYFLLLNIFYFNNKLA